MKPRRFARSGGTWPISYDARFPSYPSFLLRHRAKLHSITRLNVSTAKSTDAAILAGAILLE
jgi:hypothetical protein